LGLFLGVQVRPSVCGQWSLILRDFFYIKPSLPINGFIEIEIEIEIGIE